MAFRCLLAAYSDRIVQDLHLIPFYRQNCRTEDCSLNFNINAYELQLAEERKIRSQ